METKKTAENELVVVENNALTVEVIRRRIFTFRGVQVMVNSNLKCVALQNRIQPLPGT